MTASRSRLRLPPLLPLLAALALAANWAMPTRADPAPQAQPEAQPPASAGKVFDYRETTLDNGLRVITLEDFSCPIVAVHLWYHVGSKDEDPARQGFAHMFEHMMFRGTDRLGPTDHFNYIHRTGGENNAYTSFDQTVYVQTLPANQLELALWLEAERMTFLKIDQSSFDTERKVVEEERRLGLNRPYGTVPEKALAEIFKVHPYRWTPIGQIPHLRAAAVPELRDFWTRYYVPNNATLVIVGAVKHADAQAAAQRYFGWIPKAADPPRVTVHEPLPSEARSVKIKEDNAPTPIIGVLYRTVPAGHADLVPLQLLGTIVGGGESSRLYRDLVAENQTAVMAMAAAFSLEQDGFFGAGAVLQPLGGDAKKVLKAIRAHLKRVREEPVSDEELTKARNQMLAGLVRENLTVASKATLLGSAAVLEGDVARVNQRIAEIRKVTADDLLRVAQTYLVPERALAMMVERNLLGTLFGKKKTEDDAPITAQPEEVAPPPGRPGVKRPENFPTTAPVAKLLDTKVTPDYSTETLPNGLKVIVVANHEVPFVTLQLGLLAGAWTEPKPGLASMTLGMLTKGTEKHTEGELAKELETYAITLGGSAGLDSASVHAECLTEHVERAIQRLAEVVLTPTFPPEEFEKLRKQVRTGLAISTSDPSYVADRQLRRVLYGAHPYARTPTGELEDVDALQPDELKPWWTTFARPDMAVLIFAGDIAPQQAFALAQGALGAWQAVGPKPDVKLPALPAPAATKIYLVDRPGSVQGEIRVGQLGITRTHPGYAVSRVVSGYFGGAFNSRLNESIRVEKGLTYGASGGFAASHFAGEFRVRTFSKPETTAEAVRAVLTELDRLKSVPPTADELERTRSNIVGSFARERETPQAVAGDLWLIESEALPRDHLERLLGNVAKTTTADCTAFATGALDASKLVVVVVGDAEKLKDALAEIGPLEVIRPAAPATPAPPAEPESEDAAPR